MNKMIAFVLFAGGLLLIVVGVLAYEPTSTEITNSAARAADSISIWLLGGGTAAAILGLIGLSRSFKGYSRAFQKSTNSMI